MSVFEKYQAKAFPYRFAGQLHIGRIAGGTPTDPKVAEGWLKTKLLPAPQGCHAQYSMWDKHGNYEDRCAEVRRVAEELDVDIADGGRTIRFPMGEARYPRAWYVVNAAPEADDERADGAS